MDRRVANRAIEVGAVRVAPIFSASAGSFPFVTGTQALTGSSAKVSGFFPADIGFGNLTLLVGVLINVDAIVLKGDRLGGLVPLLKGLFDANAKFTAGDFDSAFRTGGHFRGATKQYKREEHVQRLRRHSRRFERSFVAIRKRENLQIVS